MKIKLRIPIILFLLMSLQCYSNEYWKRDYSKVDSLALTIKETNNVEKLAWRLTNQYTSDLEKYRSIFTWVAHNISYDLEALRNSNLRETDSKKVLKNGKAVCSGYSSLFSKLCELAKLECTMITGWAKEKENIGKQLSPKGDHAWNAIKIGSDWYLCDVTWAAGSTTEDLKIFSFDFKDYYFCTPPELFSYDHFPEEKNWLLGANVSATIFSERPYLSSEAIKFGTSQLAPENGTIRHSKYELIEFKFHTLCDVTKVSIQPSNLEKSTEVYFTLKDGIAEFNYIMDTYSPYLYIYLNRTEYITYKVKK